MAKVFAVVVTYNGMQWIDKCLSSLQESDRPISVIVVDNCSTDGTADYVEQTFTDVELIRSEQNLGFSKANNIGIRRAYDDGADYVFLLNQDAYVDKHTLSDLCAVANADEHVGIVSPIHMNWEGTELDWGFAGHVPAQFVSDSFISNMAEKYSCEYVNAAAWLITRSCLETVGGFDTAMFVHYGEDSNYCHRLQYHGMKLILSTRSCAYHDRGFRKGHEQEYRDKVFHQSDLSNRLSLADIRHKVNIEKMLKENRKSIIKSYLKLNFAKAKKLIKQEAFLLRVKDSRDTNVNKGLSWL